MPDEIAEILRRFERQLSRLESEVGKSLANWKLFHLNKALDALKSDHSTASMHLDEFDRVELAKDLPELEADKMPTVEEIRARFDTIAGGMF